MKRLMMMVTCGLLWSAAAHAQTCLGALTYAQAPMRAGAGVVFSSNAQTITGGVSKGFSNFFAGGGGVFETVSDVDGAAKGFYGEAGTEMPLGAAKKLFACPLVAIFKTWGLSPALDTSQSALVTSFGGSVGYVASSSGTRTIVPFGGLAIDYIRQSWNGGFFDGLTFSDTFLTLQGGVGILLNERMALIPVVAIPMAADGSKPKFGVVFSAKVGSN